jgi:hypothetical protein
MLHILSCTGRALIPALAQALALEFQTLARRWHCLAWQSRLFVSCAGNSAKQIHVPEIAPHQRIRILRFKIVVDAKY